ncbi:MAG: 30S ribosomal protein S6 [Candidatus Latescibacterota bacterium]|nr:MAG: 30S ribosomal protein S6 [Candidatus Latescibacterota bacterium]
MKNYECAVIFAPTLGTDVLETSTKKYADIITSRGGNLKELDNWGKRGLAYEINFHREGFYYFYRFSGGSDVLGELNRQLRIDENVIRHMIVRDEPRSRPRVGAAGEEAKPEVEQTVKVEDGD